MPKSCIYAGFRHLFYQMALFAADNENSTIMSLVLKRNRTTVNT